MFTDLFPVQKYVFADVSLETGNPCIEITNHHFSIVLFYSFLDLTRCIALLLIPFHLKENLINYFEVADPIVSGNTNEPRIKCDFEKEADFHEIANKSKLFKIKLEQFMTGTTKDFVKSMTLLISSFYGFNAKTSDKLFKFMSVQKRN